MNSFLFAINRWIRKKRPKTESPAPTNILCWMKMACTSSAWRDFTGREIRRRAKRSNSAGAKHREDKKEIEDDDEMIHWTTIGVKNHFSLILVGFEMRFHISNASFFSLLLDCIRQINAYGKLKISCNIMCDFRIKFLHFSPPPPSPCHHLLQLSAFDLHKIQSFFPSQSVKFWFYTILAPKMIS